MARQYLANPGSIGCMVATVEAGHIVGFQSLDRADNRYDVRSERTSAGHSKRVVPIYSGDGGTSGHRKDRSLHRS